MQNFMTLGQPLLGEKFVVGGWWCVNLFYCSALVQTWILALDLDWDQAGQLGVENRAVTTEYIPQAVAVPSPKF
jgi:hypothetical protein